MLVTPDAINQQMSCHHLYRKPAYQKAWERNPEQKNTSTVIYARDEEHARRIREGMKRRRVRIEINPDAFSTEQQRRPDPESAA